ncbi:MAG TPA: DUF3303 family protein [Actinomycetota bacterium]|nr:DUF3303 family protein [Actinomycetota bacterium]
MLHMVVNTHNPESCGFRGDEENRILEEALDAFKATGGEVSLKGWWVHPPGHEIFMLVEAPNAHAVQGALLEAGLVGRTHSRILPVLSVEEVFGD